jgi:uncharacterized membrane protein YkvA (DUF1232 family)
MNKWISLWKKKAQELEVQTYALYFALRDPRVPWYAKGFAAVIVAYAFSPIDLIPDFIPVLGYLDDFVIIPLGVALALKMVPAAVMEECKIRAAEHIKDARPQYRIMILVVVAAWVAIILLAAGGLIRLAGR